MRIDVYSKNIIKNKICEYITFLIHYVTYMIE